MVKFIYSEKATKFCEISNVDLSYAVTVKSTMEILQNFVAFSEYMNFIFTEMAGNMIMANLKKISKVTNTRRDFPFLPVPMMRWQAGKKDIHGNHPAVHPLYQM